MTFKPAAFIVALFLLIGAIALPNLRAADPPAKTDTPATKPDGEKPKSDPAGDKSSITEGQIKLEGQTVKYKATAGTLVLKDDTGKAKADVFYVSYEKHTAPADIATRPITFVFNGGPGAAAVWLHLGTAGPRRVKLTENGEAPPPPFTTEDNPATWIDVTDMVFIDPVGTGYSRPAAGEKQDQFSGVQEDITWVAEFIRLYTTRNHRWSSPKFLAGESYGTARRAGLSDHLLDRTGIALNGIIFISTVLNFETISFGTGNELPYPLFLPSYTAIAWYHKKLASDLQADLPKALKESEKYALDSYMPILAKGASLTTEERSKAVQKLARLTGLTPSTVEKANLRISTSLFRKALLEEEQQLIGRFDGRITGFNSDQLAKNADLDPSFNAYLGAYSGAFNAYIRETLKFQSDTQYEVLSGRVGQWNFGTQGNGYLNVADNLQSAIRKNAHLHVLFASGNYDLATPYFGTNYTVNHLDLSPALRRNVTQTYYPGGHMMYHHNPSRDQLHKDIKSFMKKAMQDKPAAEKSR